MQSELWQRISVAWEHYLTLPEAGRDAFLERLRQDDTELAREVEVLWAEREVSGLLHLGESSGSIEDAERSELDPELEGQTVDFRSAAGHMDSAARTRSYSNGVPQDSANAESALAPPGYEILEKLGEGGMGVVYKARHVALNRLAAIKMVLAGREHQRFRIEAEAVARLRHPHIVQIFEIGEANGRPFFALEFLEGGDLNQKIRDLLPAPSDSAILLEKMARAMQHAHEHGVVHRDLKPHNVLLDAQGEPRITDFGLARIVGADVEELTRTGQIIGTPSYMSPEQAEGLRDEIGPLSDVYALGAVLYKCLTGRPPFQGSSLHDTVKQVIGDEPVPPRRLQPQIPRELETICLKCLEKQPVRRYSSAAELADDLRRFIKGNPIQARPVPAWEHGWRWCARNRAAAALIAVAMAMVFLAIVAGAWLYTTLQLKEAAEEIAVAKAMEAVAALKSKEQADEAARLARELAANQEYFALLNTARQRIARKATGWTRTALAELRQAALLPTAARKANVLRTEAASCCAGIDVHNRAVLQQHFPTGALAFSPDGKIVAAGRWRIKELGLLESGEILLLDADTGEEVRDRLTYPHTSILNSVLKGEIEGADALAFSPDGTRLAVGTRQGWVHCWDLTRANPAPVSWQALKGVRFNQLLFSADGRSLYTGRGTATLTRWDATRPDTLLGRYETNGELLGIALLADGRQIACSMGSGTLALLDAQTLTPVRTDLPVPLGIICASPDGKMIAGRMGDAIALVDLQAEQVVRTFTDPRIGAAQRGPTHHLSFSADGALLVAIGLNDTDRTARAWEVGSGRLAATFVFAEGTVRTVGFDPARRQMAVGTYDEVLLYQIAGLAEQTWLAQHPDEIRNFHFTRDGSFLACRTNDHITVWNGQTSRERNRRAYSNPADGSGLAFNPEGTALAYPGEEGKLHFWDLADGKNGRPVPTPEGTRPCFSSDGKLWAIFPNGVVEKWDQASTRRLAKWQNFTLFDGQHYVRCIAAGKQWVIAGGANGVASLLNNGDGELHIGLKGPPSPVNSVALSPDESLAALGAQAGGVRVVSIPEGEHLTDLEDHTDSVDTLSFSPDGRLLATGSADQTVNIYRRTGRRFEHLTTLHTPAPVVQVAFHPDGRRLVVLLFKESALRVWHLDRLRDRFVQLGIDDGSWLCLAE